MLTSHLISIYAASPCFLVVRWLLDESCTSSLLACATRTLVFRLRNLPGRGIGMSGAKFRVPTIHGLLCFFFTLHVRISGVNDTWIMRPAPKSQPNVYAITTFFPPFRVSGDDIEKRKINLRQSAVAQDDNSKVGDTKYHSSHQLGLSS